MNLSELKAIGEQGRQQRPYQIRCCVASSCTSSGSLTVLDSLERAVETAGAQDQVEVRPVGCLRLCCEGPLVRLEPSGAMFGKLQPTQAASLVASLFDGPTDAQPVDPESPFFRKQSSVVLEQTGVINPEAIESSIAAGAYVALHQCLREWTPEDVIATVEHSGLRGRGGAGYPTGVKWGLVAKMPPGQKYVICNADEGDPGAFMDRVILESDPHRVLEGMAIAAYAVGANQGFIYVRGEYPLAVHRLEKAIKQARKHGLLGSQIFETPFNFRIDLRIGAGAFVCGEETALIASIEGGRGVPRPRPPYPSEVGLWGQPTLINNVETFANVPAILARGAEWFANIGTPTSTGTKVFALAGKVRNTGLVEVPMGMPLRTIVEEIGGGTPDGQAIKAVQTGGPSGGCIPASELDRPVDYESLRSLGSIMGSGGMIVMDESTDLVDVARYFMEFCMDESCGKCIPCRAGTVQMHRLLSRISAGVATSSDLEQLESLCRMVGATSLCGLGQSAPNPVLSTLRFFREEYTNRLVDPSATGLANHRRALPLT